MLLEILKAIGAFILILFFSYCLFFAVSSLIIWDFVYSPSQISVFGRVVYLIYTLGVISAIFREN